MSDEETDARGAQVLCTRELGRRDRYALLTSLVVPRPIGWLSTFSASGVPNLAPFSYFAALSSSPMLVGASIGARAGEPKDTLRNIRATRAFCVNVVTEELLEPMNQSSGDYPPEVDEFAVSGLSLARAELVEAPYVAACRAVLECRLFREVDLGESANRLVIGEVLGVRLDPALARVEGTWTIDTASLRPVGRLWGGAYSLLGEIRVIPRPRVDRG